MRTSIFSKPPESYICQIDPIQSYLKQTAFYLKTIYGLDETEALERAKTAARADFKDPKVRHFSRMDNYDKEVRVTSLYNYIRNTIREGCIIVPTFTTYFPKSVEESFNSRFSEHNVRVRAAAKHQAAQAEIDGDMVLWANKNNEQSNKKTYNNSLSGALSLKVCILYNPTGHSTLTSVTRTVTSAANTANEKFVMGNRYYPTTTDVLNNINYLASKTDVDLVNRVMEKYQLHYPTVEETVRVIRYSSDLYFNDHAFFNEKVIPYLNKLSPAHLAGICYLNDFFHLRQFNDTFVRELLSNMIRRYDVFDTDPSVAKRMGEVDPGINDFIRKVYSTELAGKGTKYKDLLDSGIASKVLASCDNIYNLLDAHTDFFTAFFLTDTMPANSNRIANMRRRCVVLSDTDSTCVSIDDWALWWKNGEVVIDRETIAITSAVSYLMTELLISMIAQISANMNVDKKDIPRMAMKNEFYWPVILPASVSKHYMALALVKEGVIFDKLKLEVKGVHFRSSAVPIWIMDDFKKTITSTLGKIAANEPVYISELIKGICQLENSIDTSARAGSVGTFRVAKMKDKSAYQDSKTTPYTHYEFWNEVMEPTYGPIPAPPFTAVKVPTTIESKTALSQWIGGIKDPELSQRLASWLIKKNKQKLPTVLIDATFVVTNGLPEVFQPVLNVKKVILDITKQHRLFLSTLGVSVDNDLLYRETFNFN